MPDAPAAAAAATGAQWCEAAAATPLPVERHAYTYGRESGQRRPSPSHPLRPPSTATSYRGWTAPEGPPHSDRQALMIKVLTKVVRNERQTACRKGKGVL